MKVRFGGNLILTIIGTLREMAGIAYLINHCVFSLQFFCNDNCSLPGLQIINSFPIRCSGWSDPLKGRVHAAANQTWGPQLAPFKLRCFEQLQIKCNKLERCQLGGPYPRIIFKTPPFGALVTPLWKFSFKSCAFGIRRCKCEASISADVDIRCALLSSRKSVVLTCCYRF